MQFGKTWEKVLSGEKVATSRIVKPGDFTSVMWTDEHDKYGRIVPDQPNHGPIVRVEMPYWLAEKSQIQRVMNGERTVYRVGQDYAVQPGRGQKSVGRIRITGIERYDVRTITLERAKMEGFDNPNAFLSLWCQMHDEWLYGHWQRVLGASAEIARPFVINFQPDALYDAWFLIFELLKGGE